MFSKKFWRDALERAISTAAQASAGAIAAGSVFDLDWRVAGGTAITATVLSVIKSLIASQVGAPESASFARNVGDGRGW